METKSEHLGRTTETPMVLHVGIMYGDVPSLLSAWSQTVLIWSMYVVQGPRSISVVMDRDGWDVWGEPIGRNGNDPLTMHVIFSVPNIVEGSRLFNDLVRRGVPLVVSEISEPLVAAITARDDYEDVRVWWGTEGIYTDTKHERTITTGVVL